MWYLINNKSFFLFILTIKICYFLFSGPVLVQATSISVKNSYKYWVKKEFNTP